MSGRNARTAYDLEAIEAAEGRLRRGGWHPSEYDGHSLLQDDWYFNIAAAAVDAAQPVIERQTWEKAVRVAQRAEIAPQTRCSESGFKAAQRRIVSVLKRKSW